MATTKTASFEELTKLATDFVTRQKGLWDHNAWVDFLSNVKKQGFDVSEDMQGKLGELLEAMKQFYLAAASTERMETALKAVVNDSIAFVKHHNGIWGHSDWEEFVRTIRKNTHTLSEGTVGYLGGVLESIKGFYGLSPVPPNHKAASSAAIAQSPSPRPTPSESAPPKDVRPKPEKAKPKQEPPAKRREKPDDLTAIGGIGPALAKKLSSAGIVSYAQIAALSDNAIADLEKNVIKFSGRIKRDDWVGQAKRLSQS